MIREHLSAVCDACVAELDRTAADYADQLDKLSFGYDPATLCPALFTNHTQLAKCVRKAGWYVDAQQLLCSKHHVAMIAHHQRHDPLSEER